MLAELHEQITNPLEHSETESSQEYYFPDALRVIEVLRPYIVKGKACYTRIWLPETDYFKDQTVSLTRVNGENISPLSDIDFRKEVVETLRNLEQSIDLLQINIAILEGNDGREVYLVLNRASRNIEIAQAGHSISPIVTKTEVLALSSDFADILFVNTDSFASLGINLISNKGSAPWREDISIVQEVQTRREILGEYSVLASSVALLQRGYNNRLNHQQIVNSIFASIGFDTSNLPANIQAMYEEITDLIASEHQDGYVRNGVRFVKQTLEIHAVVDSEGNELPVILTSDGEAYLYVLSNWNSDSFVADEAQEISNLPDRNGVSILEETFRGQGSPDGGGGLSAVTMRKEERKNIDLRGNGNFGSARWIDGNKIYILNAIATGNMGFNDLREALLSEIRSFQDQLSNEPAVLEAVYSSFSNSSNPLPPFGTGITCSSESQSGNNQGQNTTLSEPTVQVVFHSDVPNPSTPLGANLVNEPEVVQNQVNNPEPIRPLQVMVAEPRSNKRHSLGVYMQKTEGGPPLSLFTREVLIKAAFSVAHGITASSLSARLRGAMTRQRHTRYAAQAHQATLRTTISSAESTNRASSATSKTRSKGQKASYRQGVSRAETSNRISAANRTTEAVVESANSSNVQVTHQQVSAGVNVTNEANVSKCDTDLGNIKGDVGIHNENFRLQSKLERGKSTGKLKAELATNRNNNVTSSANRLSSERGQSGSNNKPVASTDKSDHISKKKDKGTSQRTKKPAAVGEETPFHIRKGIRKNPLKQNRSNTNLKRNSQSGDKNSRSGSVQSRPFTKRSSIIFGKSLKGRRNDRELSMRSDPVYSLLQQLGFSPLQAVTLLKLITISSDGILILKDTSEARGLEMLGIKSERNTGIIHPITENFFTNQVAFIH